MDKLQRVGQIIPAQAGAANKLGVGLEKLDRKLYDPAPAYDRAAALGVKYVRIQSGWARTEETEGVYDFAWLDGIADALIARGMTPWLNVVYGNSLYTERAKKVFGAVGCPPTETGRERDAWDAYVAALARHVRGRIFMFEIWNEPDGEWCWKHGVSAEEYGAFVLRTARAIRRENPEALVIGGALVSATHLNFVETALRAGMAKSVDALSFHRYMPDEGGAAEDLRALTALFHQYCPGAPVIQGESGGQSSKKGMGAMRGLDWDAEKQTKHLLRQRIVDLSENVLFTSHFSMLDMAEALNGDTDKLATRLDYGYFGLLSADFDENGIATGEYRPKPAYYALQTLAATLGDAQPDASADYAFAAPEPMSDIPVSAHAFARGGRRAVAYWLPAPLMTDTYAGKTRLISGGMSEPVLVDLRDGGVYAIAGGCLPLTDCPYLLMEKGFAAWTQRA